MELQFICPVRFTEMLPLSKYFIFYLPVYVTNIKQKNKVDI